MRCKWCNLKNEKYIKYHDFEWGVLNLNDSYLFEMLVLESFQAGLSWECVLNKRENFRIAFKGFDPKAIAAFSSSDILDLSNNNDIIRNKLKIKATVENSKVFLAIVNEFQSFKNYLLTFWDGNVIYEYDKTFSSLSDKISADLKKRGMSFVGSVIIYAYLQAIGIVNSHEPNCFLFKA